jgi:hypothetical protein
MNSTNLKSIIEDYEDLCGKMKDTSDYRNVINNILKKKNSKNKTDTIINFLNNMGLIKNEIKLEKKVLKSPVYSILFMKNGEEDFLKNLLPD